MARNAKPVVITAEGRDKGKRFVLTEMPALRAEKWALRALLALAKAGVDLPDDAVGAGMAALAVAGLQALRKLEFTDAEPLMDETRLSFCSIMYPVNGRTVLGVVLYVIGSAPV